MRCSSVKEGPSTLLAGGFLCVASPNRVVGSFLSQADHVEEVEVIVPVSLSLNPVKFQREPLGHYVYKGGWHEANAAG